MSVIPCLGRPTEMVSSSEVAAFLLGFRPAPSLFYGLCRRSRCAAAPKNCAPIFPRLSGVVVFAPCFLPPQPPRATDSKDRPLRNPPARVSTGAAPAPRPAPPRAKSAQTTPPRPYPHLPGASNVPPPPPSGRDKSQNKQRQNRPNVARHSHLSSLPPQPSGLKSHEASKVLGASPDRTSATCRRAKTLPHGP